MKYSLDPDCFQVENVFVYIAKWIIRATCTGMRHVPWKKKVFESSSTSLPPPCIGSAWLYLIKQVDAPFLFQHKGAFDYKKQLELHEDTHSIRGGVQCRLVFFDSTRCGFQSSNRRMSMWTSDRWRPRKGFQVCVRKMVDESNRTEEHWTFQAPVFETWIFQLTFPWVSYDGWSG